MRGQRPELAALGVSEFDVGQRGGVMQLMKQGQQRRRVSLRQGGQATPSMALV